MELNFDNIERMPDSMLKNVTENPDAPPKVTPLSSLSEEDVMREGAHTSTSTAGFDDKFKAESQTGVTKVNVGDMFEGKHAVEMMDALLPSLMVVLLKYMKITVRKSEMQLTEGEKKTLSPIVGNCLKTLNLDFNNPWVALAVTAGIIYGSKIIEKAGVAGLDKLAEKKTNENAKKAASSAFNSPTKKTDTPIASSVVEGNNDAVSESIQQSGEKMPQNNAAPVFTETQIKAEMNRLRRGRERAIESLTNTWKRQQKRQLKAV